MTVAAPPSNFTFLQAHDEQLVRLGILAEQYFAADPNTSLIKLRQYGEVLAQLLTAQQAVPAAMPPTVKIGGVAAGGRVAPHVGLDAAENRELIYDQVRQAGSQADSATLRYGAGTRPQKGQDLAITEWSTMNGPTDYVLSARLVPTTLAEAKRQIHDMFANIQQATHSSRGFNNFGGGESPGGPWSCEGGTATFRISFVLSTKDRSIHRLSRRRTG